MNYLTTCLCFLLSIVLTGCSIGPAYTPPAVSVPSKWTQGGQEKLRISTNEAWWRNFHDPLLNELIEQHNVYNLNVKAARARIAVARAEYAAASSQLYPVAALAGLPPSGTGAAINQLIALTTSIDPDLFGKLRQSKTAALSNLNASEADYEFNLINLYAEIASAYLELREAQARNQVLLYNLSTNKQTLQFIKSRYKAGYSNYMNLAQQDGLVETQLAELEQNKATVIASLHKIELLTGSPPGFLANKLLPPRPVPQMTQEINLGIPSELLRRRPDIIAAEQRVAAAHANIRVAMANIFPHINIGWLLGWQTQTLASNLFAVQNPDSTLFGTFTAPLFNLSLYRTIDVRKREKVLAVLNYEIVILRALHDVETHYNFYQHYKQAEIHLKHAVDQKRLVLHLSKDKYVKGSSDFETVFHTEQELNYLEFSYIQSLVKLQLSKINIYKALGGNVILPGTNSTTYNKKG